MEYRVLSIKTISLFLILYSLFSILHTKVNAQSILPLTVAPARQELELQPGEQTTINVRFYNTGDTALAGILRVADFVVENDRGIPRIIEDASQAPPRFSASNWVSLPYERMSIAANDKVSIFATITVPANARPGGRYLSIYFEPSPNAPEAIGSPKEAGLAVAPRIASLAYVKIAGDAAEKAMISRFFARNFFEYGPINVETDILNRGDYHIRPVGILSLTNIFGETVAQDKLKEQNIFPDINRSYTNSLGEKWMLGRYKVNLAASYGDKGQALVTAAYVWVFPWRVALLVILTVLVIYLLVKSGMDRMNKKSVYLEHEIEEEKAEIEKLREALKKRKD